MKLLLVQNATYLPAYGGANKANRCIVEGLAQRNHSCQVIVPLKGSGEHRTQKDLRHELSQQHISPSFCSPDLLIFQHQGVEVHVLTENVRLSSYLTQRIRAFAPTWVLVASEDPGQVLLETALEASPTRIVYIAHTTMMLPFANNGVLSQPGKSNPLSRVAGIMTISQYLKNLILQGSEREAAILHAPIYGSGPYPSFAQFGMGMVTMINPCAVKGISIFTALASRMPDTSFAAVTSWGTTKKDILTLQAFPNITILSPSNNLDDFLKDTSILLVPSLWDEAYGTIVIEAMLRGIPVLASNIGGLTEAKLGVEYVISVHPITDYTTDLDDKLLPLPIVPEQEIEPWHTILHHLLSDRQAYQQVSDISRQTAQTYVSRLSIAPFEHYLEHLTPFADTHTGENQQRETGKKKNNLHKQLEHLSPERRALLISQLRKGKVS